MWNRFILYSNIKCVGRTLSLFLLLRKRHLSWLLIVNPASCDTFCGKSLDKSARECSSNMEDGSVRINIANGLLLYYNQYSFYSQKVVMALHEKNLPFQSHIINLASGEHYKHWFLQINPRGEVPVLQDTGKIIPDSSRIIDYLEDNFSNGDTPRLIPMDQSPQIRQKVTYFRNLIENLNGNVLTIGSFLHPNLVTGNRKVPFIGPVRRQLVNSESNSANNLRKLAEQYPEARDILLQKATNQELKYEKLLKEDEFLKILHLVDDVFNKVEEELSQHVDDKKHWWLCTDRFTVADIALTILLERLNQIGMETRFWSNGKRPHLEKYYNRVKERDSYKLTIPTTFFFIKTIFIAQAPLIIGVSIAAIVAMIVGGWFVVKKIVYK